MTALKKYQRLECAALWRGASDSQRQNVFVSLGDATLVIRDSADVALAHWSLPAVEQSNPGGRPALFTPGTESEELLEIDDDDMIDAIKTVQRAVKRSRPKQGIVRHLILGVSLAAILGLGVFWLPGALVRHTAEILPEATRADIGRRLLVALEPVTGQPCRNPTGIKDLASLRRQLFGDAPWTVAVLPGGPRAAAALPGGLLVVRKSLIEPYPGPYALAGALVVEASRALAHDPMQDLMRHAGLFQTFSLLTQGEISDAALINYAQTALIRAQPAPPLSDVIARFDAAGLSTLPYAQSLDAGDETAAALTAANPHPGGSSPSLLSDAGWQRLQAICE